VPLVLVIVLVLSGAACVSAQTPAPAASQAPAFDSGLAFEHLKQLVAIGPRPAGSPGAQKTRDYINQQMKGLGITTEEQAFDAKTPAGTVRMVNVIATIPGPGTGRLIVAGHYDTKLFKEFTFVGANDAGSSTAFLIELARVLRARQNALTIELLFLDGEEAIGEWETGNTYGSRHYVFEAAQDAAALRRIKAMILVDMIGDKELLIKRESRSTPWLVDAIWAAARQLKRPEFVSEETPIDDDHLPFLAAGIPAVDIIDLEYPNIASPTYWHTAEDTIDKVSPASLQAVGDVLLAALPAIELRIR
jgi:Zn-dependent M28 family amino/carboxypeptidase